MYIEHILISYICIYLHYITTFRYTHNIMDILSDAQAIRAKRLRQLLTQKQKDDIKKAFDYFDQGGSGKIKKKELKVILRALGFNPSSEDLDKLIQDSSNDRKGEDSIDFQEFMDIMLTKIEEKLSAEDIKYTFSKIANIRKKENSDKHYITSEDIEYVAMILEEKLSKEEIEEMLTEANEAGKLLNKENDNEKDKDKEKKNKKEEKQRDKYDEDNLKKENKAKSISLHDFKAILTWENNNN